MKTQFTAKEWREITAQPIAKKGRYQRSPKSERTLGGIVFHSKKEMLRWIDLQAMERGGIITKLRRQVPYRIEINGELICTYTADAVYELVRTGEEIVEDTKSTGTAKERDFRLIMKLMKAVHGITVKQVFM